MSNLIDIQSQIEKLQKQALEIRDKQFDKTVRDILAQMQAFDITIKDLQKALAKDGKGSSRGKVAVKAKFTKKRSVAKGTKVAAKYRGPKGETWTGRGLPPRWLAALIAKGRKKEEFLLPAN